MSKFKPKNPPVLNRHSTEPKIATVRRSSIGSPDVYSLSPLSIPRTLETNNSPALETKTLKQTHKNTWTLFRFKQSTNPKSSHDSKKNSLDQSSNHNLRVGFSHLKHSISPGITPNDSFDGVFDDIDNNSFARVNIPKVFPLHENRIDSLNVIASTSTRRVLARYNSSNNIIHPPSLGPSTPQPRVKTLQDDDRPCLSLNDIVPKNRRKKEESKTALGYILGAKFIKRIETHDDSFTSSSRSNFWYQAFSPFMKKTAEILQQKEKQNDHRDMLDEESRQTSAEKKSDTPSKDKQRNERDDIELESADTKPVIGTISNGNKANLFEVKLIKIIKFGRQLILVLLFVIVVTAIASGLAFSTHNNLSHIWVNTFFNGFLLGASLLAFLKSMIQFHAQKYSFHQPQLLDKTNRVKQQDLKAQNFWFKSNFFIVYTSSFTLLASFAMVILSWFMVRLHYFANFYSFLLKNIIVLLFNLCISSPCLNIKYAHEAKEARKKKQKGFFVVRVYKNFIDDLSKAQADFDIYSNSLTPKTPECSEHIEAQRSSKVLQPDLQISKQEYEVITFKKIIGSQLVLILFYGQFILVAELSHLYTFLHNKKSLLVLPIIGSYPFAAYIFKAIGEYANNRVGLGLRIQVFYTNIMILCILPRIVYFATKEIEFIFFLIVAKILYKSIVYITLYRKIHLLRRKEKKLSDMFFDLKARKDNKASVGKKTQDNNDNNLVSAERRSRLNTIMQIKLEKNEKIKGDQEKNIEEEIKNSVYSILLSELADITFCLGSIGLVLSRSFFLKKKTIKPFDSADIKIFISSTGIEVLCDILALAILFTFWKWKKNVINWSSIQLGRPFLVNYLITFFIITVTFFFNFLCIVQFLC